MELICPKGHVSTDPDYCSECGAKIPAASSNLSTAAQTTFAASTVAPSPADPAAIARGEVCPDCGTPRQANATFCEVCRYNFVTRSSWSPSSAAVAAPIAAPPIAAPTPVPSHAVPPVPLTASESASAVAAPVAAPVFVPSPNVTSLVPSMPADTSAQPIVTSPAQPDANSLLTPHSSLLTSLSRWEAVVVVDPALYADPDPNIPIPTNEPERVFSLDFAENLIGRRSDRRDIHPEIALNDPGVSHRHAKLLRQPDGRFVLLDVGSTNGTQFNGVDVQPGVRTPVTDGDEITLGCWTRITLRSLTN